MVGLKTGTRIKDLESRIVHISFDKGRTWITREIEETSNINSLIKRIIDKANLQEGLIVTKYNGQIRLEPKYFDGLRPDVKTALIEECMPPSLEYLKKNFKEDVIDPYIKTRYWKLCDRYIFDFPGMRIDMDIEWEYEEYSYQVSHILYPFSHPFVGQFVDEREYNINIDKAMSTWMVK